MFHFYVLKYNNSLSTANSDSLFEIVETSEYAFVFPFIVL